MIVQQQAIRDHDRAMANFFAGTHRRPSWRKAGRDEGFRIVHVKPGHVRRLARNVGKVWVPKAGWMRFRWSRQVPQDTKSFRVTIDRAGRWHIAFASVPFPIAGPGTGEVAGIDRGVAVSAALSTGELLHCPGLAAPQQRRLRRLERKLARARRGSERRKRARRAVARLKARSADVRKDWCEKTSADIARRFDVIRIEDLKIENMIRSAKGSIEQPGSRESQALFRCVACGYTLNADVNAAKNIAAGHAVTARGGIRAAGPVNREPQPLPLSAQWLESSTFRRRRMSRSRSSQLPREGRGGRGGVGGVAGREGTGGAARRGGAGGHRVWRGGR